MLNEEYINTKQYNCASLWYVWSCRIKTRTIIATFGKRTINAITSFCHCFTSNEQ